MAPKKKPAVAEKKSAAAKKGTAEAKAPAAAAPSAPEAAPSSAAPPADKGSRVIGALPVELVTNRVLTHYDETAGVAIARWEVDSHKGIGNVVIPLPDAFKTRYERLRTILTGKLLPKREHLLQLRRSLQSTSIEVDATRRNIERETQTDAEQIIERLRSQESMRQSAIKHEVMKLEEELQIIERLVRRVEQANIDETEQLSTTAVLLTSAYPGTVPAVESIRTPKAVAMVELIQEFGDLYANINQQANKPVSVQVEFPTNDFPRETTERLEVMGRCDKYLHAVAVKDHMLWKALQEKERAEEDLAAERRLLQEYSQELLEWDKQTRALKQENLVLRQEHDQVVMRNRDLMRVLREYNISYQED